MSTLKVTHLQNENGTGPAMSIAVGGGVTFAGITTFHGAIDLQTPTDLRVAAGATISGSTNTIDFRTGNSSVVRIDSSARLAVGGAGSIDSQFQVVNSSQDTAESVARFESAAAGSGFSQSLVHVYKGNGYGGAIGGYIDQGVGHGLTLNTVNNGTLSERLRITSTGRVGIKTTNPDELLEVGDGTVSGGLKVSGQSSSVTSDGLTVDWESSTDSTRLFSEPQSGGSSQFKIYTTSSGTRNLAATINSSGNLVFPDGQGIDFSAVAGSGMGTGGGVLDDYEEGTWSPQITGWDGTYNTSNGKYIKIGRQVHILGEVLTNATSGTTVSTFPGLTNLPFNNSVSFHGNNVSQRHMGTATMIGDLSPSGTNGIAFVTFDRTDGTSYFPNHISSQGALNFQNTMINNITTVNFGYRFNCTYYTD